MVKAQPDISGIFEEGSLIDRALEESVKKALMEHKRAGNPVVEWQDGKVVELAPEFIPFFT